MNNREITTVEYQILKYCGYKNRGYEQGQYVLWYRIMGLKETLDILIEPRRLRSLDEEY